MISRATREYPDYTQFGKRLAELYGASVQPGVTRVGDNQILTLAAAGIANPYAFGGEDVQQALSEMLESILFTPLCDENGLFPEDGFLQEQRQLLETLDAEYNDKATYAMQRCVQTMFAGEPAGVPRIGTREAILSATREGVKAAWEYAVKHAQICQFTIGDGADDRFAQQLIKRLGMRDAVSIETKRHTASGDVKRVTEEMPVVQSKLVMGFAIAGRAPCGKADVRCARRNTEQQALYERARKAEPLLLLRRAPRYAEERHVRAERRGDQRPRPHGRSDFKRAQRYEKGQYHGR